MLQYIKHCNYGLYYYAVPPTSIIVTLWLIAVNMTNPLVMIEIRQAETYINGIKVVE